MPEQPQYLDLAQSRLTQGKLTEPDNDCALFYVTQLRTADPKNSALPRISGAVATANSRAGSHGDRYRPARARRSAAATGGHPGQHPGPQHAEREAGAAEIRCHAGRTGSHLDPVPRRSNSITRKSALRKSIEGWVDLAYTVTADGKVTKVKVLNSSPAGVFDTAASNALSRLRYKPTLQAGKPSP